MKLPFSTDIKFWVFQLAALFCLLTILFSTLPASYIKAMVNMFSSLKIPESWNGGAWIFASLCFIYLIGGR